MRYFALIALIAGCQASAETPVRDTRGYGPFQQTGIDQELAKISGLTSPDGKEKLQIQLPESHHQRNSVGIDHKGLCVFASMKHAGDWQNDKLFLAIFDWMKKNNGGGSPAKVDAMIKQLAKEQGLPIPNYVQVEETDMEILKLAVKNNMMPCVTYGYSPTGRYAGKKISHMVNCVHATNNWFAVLDNNYPGENQIEWMDEATFKRVTADTAGKAWFIILLTEPPPLPPVSKVNR